MQQVTGSPCHVPDVFTDGSFAEEAPGGGGGLQRMVCGLAL